MSLRNSRGFTLTEMVIALLVVGLLVAGVYRVFISAEESYERGTESVDAQQNARAVLAWMGQELRSAKGFSVIDSSEVTLVTDARVRDQIRTFRLDTADQDGDGITSELLLIRNPADDGSPGPVTDEIALGVEVLAFVYRDGVGAVTGSRAAVHEVEVFVTTIGSGSIANVDRAGGAGVREVTMSTRVRCRNLGKSVPTLGDATPPDPPQGLVAIMACGTATVAWSANAEADLAGYYLSYSNAGGGSPYTGTDSDQGPSPIFVGNVLNYTLTGLDQSDIYHFNLEAVDAADNVSSFAQEVSGQPQDAQPPSDPMNLAGRVIGNDSIELEWDSSPEWDIGGYEIHWFDTQDSSNVTVDTSSGPEWVLVGLTNGSVYSVRVLALDACGNASDLTNPITVTMVPCDEDITFPAIPTNFAAFAGDEVVHLSWDSVPDPDVVGYEVFFRESGGGGGTTLLVGNVTSYSVYGLYNQTTYEFQVAALDGCEHTGGFTGMVSATPVQCAGNTDPPAVPSNLTAQDAGLGDQVSLSWTLSQNEGDILGYRVWWGTVPGTWSASEDVGDTVFHEVTGLSTGVTYYFTVTAYDVCGNESAYAQSVTEIPTWGCACPPVAVCSAPADYAVLQGTVPWTVSTTACSTSTVSYVEFWIDGQIRYVDYTAPWEYGDFGIGWYTVTESDGPHQLVAVAADPMGCEDSDTLDVYVDNSGIGPSCVGVENGGPATLGGAWGESLSFPLTNLSAVDTYYLDGMSLTWSDPTLGILAVFVDGGLAYSGPSPGPASGDTVSISPSIMVPPQSSVTVDVTLWDNPPSFPPAFDLTGENWTGTFFGSPSGVCGPYPIQTDVACSVGVGIVSVTSARVYDVWGVPQIGDEYYTDRSYTLTYLPVDLDDAILVRQPNDDKSSGNSHELVLSVDHDVTVWIGYDPRGTPPDWIEQNYTDTGLTIGVTDSGTSTLDLWKAEFGAGEVTLQGNKASGWGGGVATNYVPFVQCR